MVVATVTLFYDTRRSSAAGSFVRLSVYSQQKQRLFSTGEKVSPEEWKFLERTKGGLPGTVKNEDRQQLWQRFYGRTAGKTPKKQDGHLTRAQNIIDELGQRFTFDAFADALADYGKEKESPAEQTDVISALDGKAAAMTKAGRIGNANNYTFAAKSLRRFVDSFTDEERKEFLNLPLPRRTATSRPPAVLRFEHLTPHFLIVYEQWMLAHGRQANSPSKANTGASMTTIGIYLRHLRAVVNEAIDAGVMPTTSYPFGRNKYVIPAGTNTKKALSKADIEKIKSYQPLAGTMEQRAHDLWVLSYFSNGANLTDLCHLTWGQVDFKDNRLTFVRQKTARSRKQKQTTIVAHLRPETVAILERWGTADRRPAAYVFPFLTADMDAHKRKVVVHQVTKMTNKWMKKIAALLGIEGDVNTYAARHSFATVLLKSKASLAFISKSLGHTNLKTTESYLGSFDDEEAKAFLSAL